MGSTECASSLLISYRTVPLNARAVASFVCDRQISWLNDCHIYESVHTVNARTAKKPCSVQRHFTVISEDSTTVHDPLNQ